MRRQYSHLETFAASLPYIVMVALGTVTIAAAFGLTLGALGGAAAYLAYGIAGALWIMLFMCPSCEYYGTRECPCGYGMISSKLVQQRERERFSTSFKKHIPLIVPIWFIPAVCGAAVLSQSFSWTVLGLVLAFAVNSYVILPIVAKNHSCAECPQRDDCPWIIRTKDKGKRTKRQEAARYQDQA